MSSRLEDLFKMLQVLKLAEQNRARNSSSPAPRNTKNMEEALTFFNAKDISNHVKAIEPNNAILKKELKVLLRLYMSELHRSANATDLMKYLLLCGKYNIKETESCGRGDISFGNLLWTFPDFAFYQMKKHPQFKFPWSEELMQTFPTFKVIYHNPGLVGMMPKGKKYGGLAKALVFLAYTVSVRVKDIDICIGVTRSIYNSALTPNDRREQWFPNLEITEADCAAWSKIFDEKFPNHTDIYEYFDQIA